jgi:ribosomal protein S12 methylthiotransferase accessory factor YcaO
MSLKKDPQRAATADTAYNAATAYTLSLQQTTASSGYFACEPDPVPTVEEGFAHLRRHPNDVFMHKHLLQQLAGESQASLTQMFANTEAADNTTRALLAEARLLHPEGDLDSIDSRELAALAGASPLIYLRHYLDPAHSHRRHWAQAFMANLIEHKALPMAEEAEVPLPPPLTRRKTAENQSVHVDTLMGRLDTEASTTPARPDPNDTAVTALERLADAGLLAGQEMRHESSLSLYALLRQWRFHTKVRAGRHHFEFSGLQTAYGRGLHLPRARASYAMEIVERASAFASFDPDAVLGYKCEKPLLHGRRSQLTAQGIAALDPNAMVIDVIYADEPLHWVEGRQKTAAGEVSIWVPAQFVFLFSNLDEVQLQVAPGSTGLASGNLMAEARLSALYEIMERHGEATWPYHPSRCFRVSSRDPKLTSLLDDYWARGIQIQFQDISPAFGLPCCKCFVIGRDGTIAKGVGANLNGQAAVLSALTETPYPYPNGPASLPGPTDLPILEFDALPNLSSGNAGRDLCLMENLLQKNGHDPIYVDLTRADLDLPVVRALIPGTAPSADLEDFSAPSADLLSNYLNMHNN